MCHQKRTGSLLRLLHSEILNSSDLIELTSKEVNQTSKPEAVMNAPAQGAALEELPAGRAAQLRTTARSSQLRLREVAGMQNIRGTDFFAHPTIKSTLM